MPPALRASATPDVWAGIECARVRVRGRVVDQLELTGHAARVADIDALAWLGVSAVRYPVLWERHAPRGLASADWRWPDDRLERLRTAGIQPIPGLLHHGAGPRGMALSHPGFATAFGRYAGAVAARYPWIDTYLPINEPLTTARFVGLYGFWHPHARSQAVFATALVAQCLAIRAAMDAIRRVRSDARLIVNEDVGRTFATPGLEPIATHANIRRWLTWDLLTGAIRPDHPMWSSLAVSPVLDRALRDLADRPCPPDILGVDHYVTSDRFLDDRVARYHPALRPGPDGPAYVDVEAVRVPDAVGGGMAGAVSDTWDRYRRPLALTEVFLSGEREHQVAWWTEAWETALEARRRGILLEAVTAWAVMGASGWADLLRSTDPILEPGAFEVVGDRLEPRPLAYAVRHTARGGTVPIARPTQGWWRSMDRFLPVETAA